MKTCPNCNEPAGDNDVFCQNCGNKLEIEGLEISKKTFEPSPFIPPTEEEEIIESFDWRELLENKKIIMAIVALTILIIGSSAYFLFFSPQEQVAKAVCGDKICNGDETVSSCMEDCRIIVKKKLSESCHANAECESGNCCYGVCKGAGTACGEADDKCMSNPECGENEICVDKKCVTRECYLSSDCKSNEQCVGGLCIEKEKECTLDSQCEANEECVFGKCISLKECTKDSDCAVGEKCNTNKKCVKKCGDGVCEPGEELTCAADCVGKKFALTFTSNCTKRDCDFVMNTTLKKTDVKTIIWYFDGNNSKAYSRGGYELKVTSYEYPKYGTYEVTLSVTDRTADEMEYITKFVTAENKAPVPVIDVSPLPSAENPYVAKKTKITFKKSAKTYDPDKDNMPLENVSWYIGQKILKSDGTYTLKEEMKTVKGKNEITDYVFNTDGIYFINLNVSDDDIKGEKLKPATGTTTAEIKIGQNQPPKNAVINMAHLPAYSGPMDKFYNGETIAFSSPATDPDGDNEKMVYEWDFGDGTKVTKTGSAGKYIEHIYSPLTTPADYKIKLKITDQYLISAPADEKDIKIEYNAKPDVTGMQVTLTPNPAYSKDDITLEITKEATDAESHAIRYEWWYSGAIVGNGKTYKPAKVPGTYVLTVKAIDTLGATNDDFKYTYTLIDSRPAPASFVITYSTGAPLVENKAVYGQQLRFTASNAKDPDNPLESQDLPDSGYSWTFGEGSASATGKVATYTYTTPGSKKITLKVADDDGEYRDASQTITVENLLPTGVGIDTINPNPVYLEQTSALTAKTATDPDGGSVTYEWWSNDVYIGKGKTVTTGYVLPGAYTIKLRVTDDDGGYVEATSNINAISYPDITNPIGITLGDVTSCSGGMTFDMYVENRAYLSITQIAVDVWATPAGSYWANHYPLYGTIEGGSIASGETKKVTFSSTLSCKSQYPVTIEIKRIGYGTFTNFAYELMKYCWPDASGSCGRTGYNPYNFELEMGLRTVEYGNTYHTILFTNRGPGETKTITYDLNAASCSPETQTVAFVVKAGASMSTTWDIEKCTKPGGYSLLTLTNIKYQLGGAKQYESNVNLNTFFTKYAWPNSMGECPGGPYCANIIIKKVGLGKCSHNNNPDGPGVEARVTVKNMGSKITGIKYIVCTGTHGGCTTERVKNVDINMGETKEVVLDWPELYCAIGYDENIKLQIMGVNMKTDEMSTSVYASIKSIKYCWAKGLACPIEYIRVQ